MVEIRLSDKRKEEIAELYFKRLDSWIHGNKKRWSIKGDSKANEMMAIIKDNSRKYFLAPASQLEDISNEFWGIYGKHKLEKSYGRFENHMRNLFKNFMSWTDPKTNEPNGYWLMKMLGVKVCPYCNSNYTITISNCNVKVRPDFDHFLPQSIHPSLILSFYNLVPSCPQCNRLKGLEQLKVNPWERCAKGEKSTFRVDTSKVDFPAKPVIMIDGENENRWLSGIRELYNEHTDYVKDILDKIQAYNPATYLAIARDFQGIVHTEADLERMVWGNYTNLSGTDKRPLAKLTMDILEQYKKYL